MISKHKQEHLLSILFNIVLEFVAKPNINGDLLIRKIIPLDNPLL